jgi:hypothetical protein
MSDGWGWGWGSGGFVGGQPYYAKVLSYSPIAYWQMAETSGTTAVCSVDTNQNGTYARDVSTMGTGTGIGDGNTAPAFDGTNDVLNAYSATLAGAFDGTEGTIALWCRVNAAGVWSDSTERYAFRFEADANNYVRNEKHTAVGDFRWLYKADGATEVQVSTLSTTAWFHAAITWSDTNDQVIYYVGGVQQGSIDTTVGTWAGPLANTLTVIGAGITTPLIVWYGWLAHAAVWTSPLTQPQLADLATV